MHAIAASQRLAKVFKSLVRDTHNAWQFGKVNIHIPRGAGLDDLWRRHF